MANDEIRRGYEFHTKEEKSWKALKEGWGVVVIGLGTRGFRAYGDSQDADSSEGEDILRKNFAGAKYNHEKNAFLVIKKDGLLVWQSEEQKPKAEYQRVSAIPLWKQKKRFHFSETIEDAIA